MSEFSKIPDSFINQNLNLKTWNNIEGLWYLGDINLLNLKLVSVVGSRKISQHGIVRTKKLVKILVENNFCVVSGLASGVDTIAHEETLRLGGKTIAVMGTPIDEVYPKENLNLKEKITDQGLVISQFKPGTPTQKFNFPKRNDLMAAISLITIVVEASESSGTRHQINSALKYGKIAAFTKFLADSNVKWVNEVLKESQSYVISNENEFVSFLLNLRKDKSNSTVQLKLFDE